VQHFDGDAAIQFFIVSGVNGPETPLAKAAIEPVTGKARLDFSERGSGRFGLRTPLPDASAGFDAFAGLAADSFGQRLEKGFKA
jgi:hypothetical protein